MQSLLSHQLRPKEESTITKALGVTSLIGDVSTLATTVQLRPKSEMGARGHIRIRT